MGQSNKLVHGHPLFAYLLSYISVHTTKNFILVARISMTLSWLNSMCSRWTCDAKTLSQNFLICSLRSSFFLSMLWYRSPFSYLYLLTLPQSWWWYQTSLLTTAYGWANFLLVDPLSSHLLNVSKVCFITSISQSIILHINKRRHLMLWSWPCPEVGDIRRSLLLTPTTCG